MIAESDDPDASNFESCEKAIGPIWGVWPSSVSKHTMVSASQILMIVLFDADASLVESCDMAIGTLIKPVSLAICRKAPLLVSQIPMILLSEADATRIELHVKGTELTEI